MYLRHVQPTAFWMWKRLFPVSKVQVQQTTLWTGSKSLRLQQCKIMVCVAFNDNTLMSSSCDCFFLTMWLYWPGFSGWEQQRGGRQFCQESSEVTRQIRDRTKEPDRRPGHLSMGACGKQGHSTSSGTESVISAPPISLREHLIESCVQRQGWVSRIL